MSTETTAEVAAGMRVDDGWRELTTAAVVGTGRRTVPDWPDGLSRRDGDGPEQRLLDAAAVGGVLRRAGRVPQRREEAVAAAPVDPRPSPPPPARQLLDVVLAQPPVGRRLQPVVVRAWCEAAERAGVRVHHGALVPLLEAATSHHELRPLVGPVLGERGRWLGAQRTEWAWVAAVPADAGTTTDVDSDLWARLPASTRGAVLRVVRRREPDAGRALLLGTWSTDAAGARADLLELLATGLGPADEDLLERALDDRATRVREVARRLLDRLPASARAARAAARLRPLVCARDGRVVVALPAAPDAAAVRDGLGKGPRGQSERAWWLGVLTRAAPLEVWTEQTGLTPDEVVATLDEPAAALALRETALARRDVTWARAHVAHGWEPALLALLPPDERAVSVLDRLAVQTTHTGLLGAVRLLDGPWPAAVGTRVLEQLAAASGPVDEHALAEVLSTRLPPDLLPLVQRLAARDTPLHDPLHRVAHVLSLVPAIQEAFR